jgi:asparagine synthase (glutamine-hydrolysing)
MCGILGFVANDGRPASRSRLLAANERMHARGPDGAGEFVERDVALAMRRLAVIDVAGGNQPLFARDGEVVAFQNGEIYNHAELRRELETKGFVFKTRSDTEVLAHGFVAWGMDGLLQRIDGMHAIVLFDRTARTLWLARDRFGEKPLFVKRADGDGGRHDDPKLAFASSIKALGQLVGRTFEIDPVGLDAYLALHFVPGRRTIFRGVERVLPGERWKIELDSGAIERRRFYELPLLPPRTEVTASDDDALRVALDAAVRSRLVSDVPVGVFLSGGLDSSLVAALAAKARPGIDTFSMGFAGSMGSAADADADESRFAELVARHVGSRHHAFRFDATSFLPLFADVAAALDEPVGDPAQLPLLWLCREARQVATVVLSGEGADELFGGYDYYAAFAPAVGLRERWARWRSRPAPAPSARLLETDERALASGFPFVLSRAQRRALLADGALRDPDEWERDLLAKLGTARDPLQRASAADLLTWLPDDLLVKLDRMAMATSLEGRAPYLDPKLAELALALPPAERTTVARRKVALTRAAAPLLPLEILEREKHGFVLPMKRWLAELFASEGGAARWFAARPLPPLDGTRLVPYLPEPGHAEVRRARPLFSLALLHAWHAEFRAQERAWLAEATG